jgi:hypothetical protein
MPGFQVGVFPMHLRHFYTLLLAGVSTWLTSRTFVSAEDGILAARKQAGEILQKVLRESKISRDNAGKQIDLLIHASNTTVELLGPNSGSAQRMKSAVEKARILASSNIEQAIQLLRKTMSEVQKDLSFQPINEAEQPKGFPSPTPVGEVEVKHYPVYRKAQAEMSRNRAFWTLFLHIKKNDIAMTAPVEMNYDNPRADEPKEKKMAFLYSQPSLGNLGKDGSIDVVDVPAMTVVSTGVRGEQNVKSVQGAQQRLEAWLESHKDTWITAGPMRTMAYNSPFVPRDRNYFEVQFPIRVVSQNPAMNTSEQ